MSMPYACPTNCTNPNCCLYHYEKIDTHCQRFGGKFYKWRKQDTRYPTVITIFNPYPSMEFFDIRITIKTGDFKDRMQLYTLKQHTRMIYLCMVVYYFFNIEILKHFEPIIFVIVSENYNTQFVQKINFKQ